MDCARFDMWKTIKMIIMMIHFIYLYFSIVGSIALYYNSLFICILHLILISVFTYFNGKNDILKMF